MAQLVKCLLCKHGELSLDSRYPHKKPGMVRCVCKLNAGDVKSGGSLRLAGQKAQLSHGASERPCLNTISWRVIEKDTDFHMPVHTCAPP